MALGNTAVSLETLIAQLYKSESASLLAVLTRIFGAHNYDLAEDVLHDAFAKALNTWQDNGIPDSPPSWIMAAAKNKAIDAIRANKNKIKFAEDITLLLESEWSVQITVDDEFSEQNIKDDLLRMIFTCCHQSIKPENRIPFILRTLCGFSIPAIARALLIPDATVKKRLLRTKDKLKNIKFELPPTEQLANTMDSVHTVLYLLFNEGFHSSAGKQAIELSLCQESIALVNMLVQEPKVANQETLALFALMHFHIARVNSRVDTAGFNIPLDLQDRSLWQYEYIKTACYFLNLSKALSSGTSNRFFIEASIAKEHCIAETFEDTNWPAIVELYATLADLTKSPVAGISMAIARGYSGQVSEAIEQATELQTDDVFKHSHIANAALAHLYAMAGNRTVAYEKADKAKQLGGTPHEHQLMMQQLVRLLEPQ